MAAGLGFKEFTTGDVLTAADANGYLASQVVMVFADSAARTSAITSPQEGMFSFLKDTNSTEYYSGTAWVSVAPTASSGLTLITRTSFSAVATQDFTNVFTTTYPSYKIIIEKIGSSDATATLQMQTRNAGGVVTGADWYGAVGKAIFNSNSYAGTEQTSAQSSLRINAGAIGGATDNTSTTLDITDVAVSGRIRVVGNTFNLGGATSGFVGGTRLATETTTGFRLFASAGNITGTVAVYGYGA
jgi:hypothetical protein